MQKKDGWIIIDEPGNPYCLKDTTYAQLRIFKFGDGFYGEVHGGSYERIRLNANGKWESHYFYSIHRKEGGFSGGSTTFPVWVSDKEIRSIDEMKSFLEGYVQNWNPDTIKERKEDYEKQLPEYLKREL